MSTSKKLLLVFAHPDDESFVTGGTIAKYVDRGWHIELICATRGEAGDHGNYSSKDNLKDIRTQELLEAKAVLGIQAVHFLDYKDGQLKHVNPGELEDILVKKMKDIEPDIVITFESHGISNHPDHMKISLSTTYAFQKYAEYFVDGEPLGKRDPRRRMVDKLGGFEGKEEPKLYHACMPKEVVQYLLENKVIPEESFGKPWEGIDDKKITTVINISDYTEKKVAALAKHVSQRGDVERFLSLDSQPLAYQEYYLLRMEGKEEFFLGKGESVSNEL